MWSHGLIEKVVMGKSTTLTLELFLLKRLFDVDHFLKSLLNLLEYCFCFMFGFFWPRGMEDLSSPNRDQTLTPYTGRQSLNYLIAREVLAPELLKSNIILSRSKQLQILKKRKKKFQWHKPQWTQVNLERLKCIHYGHIKKIIGNIFGIFSIQHDSHKIYKFDI